MKRRTFLAASLVASTSAFARFPPRGSAPNSIVGYRGVSQVTIPTATGLTAFEAMTGVPANLIGRFGYNSVADTTPADSLSVLQTYAAELPANRDVHWSLPLAWSTITLAQVASGSADSFFNSAVDDIKAARPNQRPRIYRVGPEANVATFAWENGPSSIAAFQRVVGLIRARDPYALIDWCVSVGDDDPEAYYPGDAYVDVISGDVYLVASDDISVGESSFDAWIKIKSINGYFLDALLTFANLHGKPIAISEWGTDSNDSYDFIRLFAQWISDNNARWSLYWDESLAGATDFQDKLSDGSKPKAAAEFVKCFGLQIITTVPSWKILENQTWDIPLTGWQTGAWTVMSGSGAIVANSVRAASAANGNVNAITVRQTLPNGFYVEKVITASSVTAYTAANATALAFIARLNAGTLDEGYKEYLDTLCAGLTTDGLLTLLDGLWIFAARDQADARLNVNGTYGAVTSGGSGVTWTTNRGFMGSKTVGGIGGNGYLDLGFGGQRIGNVFGQNSAIVGGWSLKDIPVDAPFIAQSNFSGVRLRPRSSGDTMQGQINDFTDLSAANTNGGGFVTITRTASNARAERRETTAIANDTQASTGTNAPNFFGFAEAAAFPNVHEAAVMFVGSGQTTTQMNNLRARLLTFLTAVVPGGV